MSEAVLVRAPVFDDRRAAGRVLADEAVDLRGPSLLVFGLARGGVVVAAEVARILGAPLDAIAVRKVGHPWQPEYAIGAVTPRCAYLRDSDDLSEQDLEQVVGRARLAAIELDARLHAERGAPAPAGKVVLVVDDGLATGATMIAALRALRAAGAALVIAGVPVGAAESLGDLQDEADRVICPFPVSPFVAVSIWYARFGQVGDREVIRLLDEAAKRAALSP